MVLNRSQMLQYNYVETPFVVNIPSLQVIFLSNMDIASHAGDFRDKLRAPLKKPAWEAYMDKGFYNKSIMFGACEMRPLNQN